jgi:hypothetical protein
MPRTSSDALFQLIHSLHRTEKGYVKKYCSRHIVGDGNDYLRLFDAIDAQSSYDDKGLRAALADTPMIKRLPSVKNYLYQQILEAMRAYHAAKSPEREITELLLDADFLWEKALYDQAMRRVRKAKELCVAHDEYGFWLKTISWEKNYRSIVRERPEFVDAVDPLGKEQEQIIELVSNTIAYEHIGNMLQHYLILRAAGDRSGEAWLRDLPNHPLMHDAATALSRPAKLNFHLIWSNWYAFVGKDPQRAADHATQLLALLDNDPLLIIARPDLELGVLQTYLQRCVDATRFEAYRTAADRLWDPSGGRPSKNIDVKRFYRAMSTELGYAIVSGDTSRIIEKLPYLRERFAALHDDIPPQSRISAAFLAARICFDTDRPRDAGWWLREALAEDENIRTDIHIGARLLQLRMADARNDRDLIRTLTRSLIRFVSGRKLRTQRLDIVLSYYRRAADAIVDRDRNRLRRETAERLSATTSDGLFDAVSSSGLDAFFGTHSGETTRPVEPAVNY